LNFEVFLFAFSLNIFLFCSAVPDVSGSGFGGFQPLETSVSRDVCSKVVMDGFFFASQG